MYEYEVPQRGQKLGWLVALCVTAVFLFVWCSFWIPRLPGQTAAGKAQAHAIHQKDWATRRATVVSVSPIDNAEIVDYDGDTSNSDVLYRIATVRFWALNGHLQKAIVFLPPTFQKGDKEWMVLNRQTGETWFQDDLKNTHKNPRSHIGNPVNFHAWLALILGFIVGGIVVLLTTFTVVESVRQKSFAQLIGQLVSVLGRKTGRLLAWLPSELKLRWEFRRRRHQSKPLGYAYKSLRRMQQELRRMDDTPAVVEARRRANKLLTEVIEQDNLRLAQIQAVMTSIGEDVDLKGEARREVEQELG